MKVYVLDASAVMTFFENRPGADRIRELFYKAEKSQHTLLMSAINWGEVYYSSWRLHGEQVAGEKLRQIEGLPIEIVAVDMPEAKHAATLKATLGLPYADCFVAALAASRKAAIVTSDADFKVLKDDLELSMI